ncbi:MAG: hypothetical protein JWO80_2664 [Bryobacterales bacterium]|nr:hypothetical protein [Bryobacterales bacterium]
MPYFERLPYAEMIARAGGIAPESLAVPATPPLMERAAAILNEQSRGLPAGAEPAYTTALPANGWVALVKDWAPLKALSALPGVGPGGPSLAGGVCCPTFRAPAVKSGEKAAITISILNESDEDVSWSFMATDLMNQSGSIIPRINIVSIPRTATVPARGSTDVRVEIEVPPGSSGDYVGVLACSEAVPGILFVTAT